MSKDEYTKEDEFKDKIDNVELDGIIGEDNEVEVSEEILEEEEKAAEVNPDDLIKAEKDKYLRLFAEFENYKKRTSKERMELFKTAGQELMTAVLPVIDDYERALSHIEEKPETKELKDGVTLVHKKFLSILEQKGLSLIEVKAGDSFDADLHQAITQIPAPSDDLKGKIIDCIEKGYKLGDKIIRHPKVVVGQA